MQQVLQSPFDYLVNLQRALQNRHKSDWLAGATTAYGAYPPINIFRRGHDYVAIVELPCIDKAKLDIQVKDNVIRLSGEKVPNYPEEVSAHRRERVFGKFDRTITVPVRVNADGVKAEYKDGILALYIPRAEDDKPKSIQIA